MICGSAGGDCKGPLATLAAREMMGVGLWWQGGGRG